MALTDDGNLGATMLVGPTGGMGYPYPVFQNGGGNGGNNGFGGDHGWWIVLLIILLAAGNGFGNNGNNGGGFGGGMPYVINNDGGSVQRGFDQAAIMSGITGVQSGVQNLSTQLCNCCGDMQMAVANGFSNAEVANNARQIANMQQAFAAQTAMMQGFNNVQSQFADCCCENRLANCQTQNIIQNEGNMTRFADANNTRDLLTNQTANTQAILDKLCQLELDAKNDKINDLERQLTMATFNASQIAQTAEIQRGQVAEIDQMYQRLKDCPVPSQPVYGMTPIFTCPNNNNNSCGCGCGNF